MERRYALLDGMGVRDIKSYNRRIKERNIATEKIPYLVVIIDEFADLMATTGKETRVYRRPAVRDEPRRRNPPRARNPEAVDRRDYRDSSRQTSRRASRSW